MLENVKEQFVLVKNECKDYQTNKTEYKNCIFNKYITIFRSINTDNRRRNSPFGVERLRDMINLLDF